MTALAVFRTSACTAVGLTSAAAAAAVRSTLAGFAEYPRAMDAWDDPAIVAAPPGIAGIKDPDQAIAEMAAAAFTGLTTDESLALFLALPEPRPGLRPDLFDVVKDILEQRFPGIHVHPAHGGGHAAAGAALAQAADYTEAHANLRAAVIGVDSYLHPETIDWLDSHRQLHASYNAWGFIPGAAAGGVLVGHPGQAAGDSGPVRAVIEAVAIDREAAPIKTDGVCLGRAMSNILDKLLDGQLDGPAIDAVYCDQNGEAYRADEMGFMLTRASDRFRDPSAFVTPADCWGDVGAASLPLYITLAAEAADRGYAAGPISVHLAGSESGLRAGLRVRTPMREP